MHRLEEHFYAVKKIELRVKKDDDLRKMNVFREVATMVKLHHNRIVRYITSWIEQEDHSPLRKVASLAGNQQFD